MGLKETISDTAEKIYDLVKDGKYDVEVNFFPRKEDQKKPVNVRVVKKRNTKQDIKWRSKGY